MVLAYLLAVQKNVFDIFTQSDNSITRKYGGTGLGLSISRQITHLLNGYILLDSKENSGSTFTLSVPVEVLDCVIEEEMESDIVEKHYSGHVLIVEDNKTNQFLIDILH